MPGEFSNTQELIVKMHGLVSEQRTQIDRLNSEQVKVVSLLERLVESEIALKAAITDHRGTFDRIFVEIEKCRAYRHDLEKSIEENRDEIHAWINRIQGAWKLGSILWGAFSVFLVSSSLWMFSEVMNMRDRVNIHEHIVVDYMKNKHGQP